jgi:hypothetical protein
VWETRSLLLSDVIVCVTTVENCVSACLLALNRSNMVGIGSSELMCSFEIGTCAEPKGHIRTSLLCPLKCPLKEYELVKYMVVIELMFELSLFVWFENHMTPTLTARHAYLHTTTV